MTEPTGSKLNTTLLAVVIGIAGFVAHSVWEQGQSLAAVTELLKEHSGYFQEIHPFVERTIQIEQRMNGVDNREDRIEKHIDATDARVDMLERPGSARSRGRPD